MNDEPHIACAVVDGDGPPVVLISQIGTSGSAWQSVIDRLTTGPQVVTYDRPGIGDSSPRSAPNPPLPYSVFAEELAVLLGRHGITAPAVVVGHSFGSLIARMFAARYSGRVAGIVHVDGSVPALALWPGEAPMFDGEPPSATEIDMATGRAELLAATVPAVPGVVLVRTAGRWDVPLPDPAIDGFWQQAQASLAKASRAPLLVAADAGHQLPREAPDLVAYAIDCVVDAVRAGRPSVDVDPARVAAVGGAVGPAG